MLFSVYIQLLCLNKWSEIRDGAAAINQFTWRYQHHPIVLTISWGEYVALFG